MKFSGPTPSIPKWLGLFLGLQIVFLISVGFAMSPLPPSPHREVRVAVAANFADCLDQLGILFTEATGCQLVISRGSTGKHFAQIKAGAPFDVFFAADGEHPARLEADGLTAPGSRFTYAVGRLVLWNPRAEPDSSRTVIQALDSQEYRHLAIANPRLAPYGLAARQALTALGLWDRLQPLLVMGQTVGQTWQFVATGNAELGLVARSQMSRWLADGHPAGCWWIVDADLHDPIDQQAVLLRPAAGNEDARRLLEFVRGPRARLIIKTYGYTVPED